MPFFSIKFTMAIRHVHSFKPTVQKIQTRDQSCDHMASLAPIQETCIAEFPKRNGKQRVLVAYHFSCLPLSHFHSIIQGANSKLMPCTVIMMTIITGQCHPALTLVADDSRNNFQLSVANRSVIMISGFVIRSCITLIKDWMECRDSMEGDKSKKNSDF